jgi:hypothetical protein
MENCIRQYAYCHLVQKRLDSNRKNILDFVHPDFRADVRKTRGKYLP